METSTVKEVLKDVANPSSWVMQNGGDGWAVENDDVVGVCFASSFEWCKKSQLIDLIALGYEPEHLDSQPIVSVADKFRGLQTCGSEYQLKVELLDANKKPLTAFERKADTTLTWQTVNYKFKNYGPGLRYINFEHSGKDKKNWKGHYGAKVGGSSVTLGQLTSRQVLKDVANPSSWVMQNGGDGWAVEKDDFVRVCFASSFEWCKKSQLVDLIALGYKPEALDSQPIVNVADNFRGVETCGSEYQLKVQLLDANKQPLNGNKSAVFEYNADTTPGWQTVTHMFENYGSGLRFINFEHSGKDKKHWKGNFGAKVGGSSVCVGL